MAKRQIHWFAVAAVVLGLVPAGLPLTVGGWPTYPVATTRRPFCGAREGRSF